ncbi:tRNA (adenosine(37)-N6)-threonylcarbamoyltransferase complex ATPase subunit type 1 TsaE [Hanstruepera marina]|uniref:tRNA (adenosine(37)-N6)-threonylcarbamoyltransferase complex ATPase subunit type 1 TsaE n=1 Tax=Hanstruepera marina TaxID=2873265 RepID=UPI002104CD1F|nr:tRNA (adenosine(37)-N6)-threonylcarbamoyltransferase complex ATPase subunit type 1 TsaE [Hanstruepera marina]
MERLQNVTIEYSLNDVKTVADQIIKLVKSKTILFNGEMGSGKTTLIKALVEQLGSDDDVSSPTFSIVNEYVTDNDVIYHFDLYRINSIEEAYDFGIEDYLDTTHWKFIEWPDLIIENLDDDYSEITLKINDNNKRILTLK